MLNKETIYIFTDGSAKNNGRSNAKAGYSVYFTDDLTHCINTFTKFNKTKMIKTNPTNNKAELSAILLALKIVDSNKENSFSKPKNIEIVTDSKYSIDCVTKWIINWEKNNFINSKGQDVKNKELIISISFLLSKLKKDYFVTFKHVYSHTVKPKNEQSIEYFYWMGNYLVDDKINQMFDLINKIKKD